LYNVPGRTVADLANDTILRLAQVPRIVGIKDATANIERGSDLLKRAPAGFSVYSGDDATAIALQFRGGGSPVRNSALVVDRRQSRGVRTPLSQYSRICRPSV